MRIIGEVPLAHGVTQYDRNQHGRCNQNDKKGHRVFLGALKRHDTAKTACV